MKIKRIIFIPVSVVIIFVIIVYSYITYQFRYSDYLVGSCITNPQQIKNDDFVVGVIGDSWIAGSKLDDGLRTALNIPNVKIRVKSSGHPGARTKLILEDFYSFSSFLNTSYPNSKKIYVIEGGINDAFAYLGRDFYIHHIDQLVKGGLECGDKVLIISIPFFDRSRVETFPKKIRWSFYKAITGDIGNDNADYYNQLLMSKYGFNKVKNVKVFDVRKLITQNQIPEKYYDGVHMVPKYYDELGYDLGLFISKEYFGNGPT